MSKKPAPKKRSLKSAEKKAPPLPAAVLKTDAPASAPRAVANNLPSPLNLDLGCGPSKKEGHYGVDQYAMPGVDLVWNLGDRARPWPFADGSVDGANCSHFFEHLTQEQRPWFVNELYRVLKPGAQVFLTTPYWASSRAYGDATHQWPPVGEMTFYYFHREWREKNAPHTDKKWWALGFDCDFDHVPTYSLHGALVNYERSRQEFEVTWYKEAAQDITAVLTKRQPAPSFK